MNETYFEQLLQWLARCPALTGIDLRVDDLPPAAGTGALFPKVDGKKSAGLHHAG